VEPNKKQDPQVSIIVAVTEDRGLDSIFDLLDSFFPQDGDVEFEFIVVDEADARREQIFRERFPWVTLIQTEKLMPVPHQRNVALPRARGEILAFADDHVFFPRNYLKGLIEALSSGYRIAGGPVANANPETLASWVQYLSEYHQWFPMKPEGEVDDLPGSNFAYRTDLLRELKPFLTGQFGVETHLHKQARESGEKLYFSHGLEIAHINDERWSFILSRRFAYGRLFAARRGFPLWKRIVYVALSPLIALVEYGRIFGQARHDRSYLAKFIQTTPMLLPTLLVWMAGESTGYLFGPRRSDITD